MIRILPFLFCLSCVAAAPAAAPIAVAVETSTLAVSPVAAAAALSFEVVGVYGTIAVINDHLEQRTYSLDFDDPKDWSWFEAKEHFLNVDSADAGKPFESDPCVPPYWACHKFYKTLGGAKGLGGQILCAGCYELCQSQGAWPVSIDALGNTFFPERFACTPGL